MKIDGSICRQTLMQQCRDAPCMAFAGGADQNNLALGFQAAGLEYRHRLGVNGYPCQVIGHAPAVDALPADFTFEGIVLPLIEAREGLAVRMTEKKQTAACTRCAAAAW